jgi:hypothetical protein
MLIGWCMGVMRPKIMQERMTKWPIKIRNSKRTNRIYWTREIADRCLFK